MTEIIRTERVNVGYEEKVVVHDVDIKALKGKILCLIGPNGAGKSTILRTVTGALAPVSGVVYVSGKNVKELSSSEKAKTMSVVLTDKISMPMTTVEALVAMGRIPHTGFLGSITEQDREIINEAMELVGITSLRKRFFANLSDGEKQKVLIARAVAQEPGVMVLDEPTSHLDIKNKIEIVRILDRLSKEKNMSIILSLHDVDIAIKTCEYVIMVKDGEIAAQGYPEEIVGKNTISELYGIKNASFDSTLGCVELSSCNIPQVAVISGNGTGIPFFRLLCRRGIGFAAGILYENDIDTVIAENITDHIVKEKPFVPVGEEAKQKMRSVLSCMKAAIDTGAPAGEYNRVNFELLDEFAEAGGKIFSLRSEEECRRLYKNLKGIKSFEAMHELLSEVEKVLNG